MPLRFSSEPDRRFRKPSEADVKHAVALRDIMRERGCSPDEADRIHNERQLREWQATADRFFADVKETAQTFEQVAEALPQHRREMFWDLPLSQAVDMAVRHLAPRQRGRCERRPRVRAVRRRRSSRSTRAGPSSDPDEPEPPRRGRHLRLLHNGHEPRCGARGFALFRRPRPLERPEKGERR
jgi:hypothetical protein